jgi:hypothetical protein
MFRKTLLVISLVLTLSQSAFAVTTAVPWTSPWLWPFYTTAVFSNLINWVPGSSYNPALGLYYWVNALLSPTVDGSSATVTVPSKVAWADLTAVPPNMDTIPLTTPVTLTQMQNLSDKNGAANPAYPNVYNATHGRVYADPTPTTPVGAILLNPNTGGSVKVTSTTTNSGSWTNGGNPGPPVHWSTGSNYVEIGSNQYYNGYSYFYGTVTFLYYTSCSPPPPAPLGNTQSAQNLSANGASGAVSSSVAAELQKMVLDSNYVGVFSDATTGLPPVYPPSAQISSPDAVSSFLTANGADGSKTPGTAGTGGSSGGAGGATAGTAPSSSGSTSGGSAGTLVGGAAGGTGTAPTHGTSGTPGTIGNIGTSGTFTVPALHTVKFDSANGLIGALKNAYPFSMLPSVAQTLTQFVASPTPPVMVMALPFGQSIHIDLSIWDDVAKMCRFVIAALMTSGFILKVVSFWRGIS